MTYALVSKTKFNTFIVSFHSKEALIDEWECYGIFLNNAVRTISHSALVIDTTDPIGNKTYKLCLEKDKQVQAAIRCEKVFVEMGVRLEDYKPE